MKKFATLIALSFLFTMPTGSWGGDSGSKLFESADTDKNGMISLEEFINAPFASLKTKEGKKLVPSGTKGATPLTATEKNDLFTKLDRDKNKTVDRKEWVIFRDGKFLF